MPGKSKKGGPRSDREPHLREPDLAGPPRCVASFTDHSPQWVLLAEDEALISMLIEDELIAAGFEVAGPFTTCAAASHWLDSNTPDVAILDHQLADGPCTHVAVELRRRGVPFVTVSASSPSDMPDVMRNAPGLTKPDSMQRLPGLLRSLLHDPRVALPGVRRTRPTTAAQA